MSGAPGKLVVHHRSSGVAIGTIDGYFLMRCFGDVTPADVKATLLGHHAVMAFRPAGSASIVAVDPTVTFPGEAMRRTALEVTRQTAANTLAQTLIVLGDGFWASTVRGIMTTIGSLSVSNHPRKVVRYEEEGVAWCIDIVGESVAKYKAPLLAGLAQLKPAVTAPPPSPKSVL